MSKLFVRLLALIFTLFSFSFAETETAAVPGSSHTYLVSSKGTIAHNFFYGEAIGKVLIERAERIVAEIDGARAISFSPNGEKLLLMEAAMDDDERAFVVDMTLEPLVIVDEAERRRIGPRYVIKTEWTPDGNSVRFFQPEELSSEPITVEVP